MTYAPGQIPSKWLDIICEVPGYDPRNQAEGFRFDATKAALALAFFQGDKHGEGLLVFVEGERAGEPFQLELWQQAIVANLFAWVDGDGLRRYREAFVFVPRKNGKTPLVAGIAMCILFTDLEPGAQLYSAAADKEQAAILFRHASQMVAREPELLRLSRIYRSYKSIEYVGQGYFKALSADAHTKHGSNVSFAAIDELHAHPNADLMDVLATGTASRRQPLIVVITTADWDRPSACNEKYDYASKVRDGIIVDPAFFPCIYEAKPDADWTDPAVWAAANPNLDVSVKRDYLVRECQRAQESPVYENTFKRLHLNIKTEQAVRWISMAAWDAGNSMYHADDLHGQACYAGLDLSTKTDLSALVLYFPEEAKVLAFFWAPADKARNRERRDRVPYLTWAKEGFIELTPGNVIDYAFIRRRLNELKADYNIQEIAYDPWSATQLALQLQDEDGFTMVEFRQGYASMSEPVKTLEAMIVGGKIRHDGNPVLRWMASNCAATIDAAENMKLDKKKSSDRIDGIVALTMAVGRAMVATQETQSVYETRGIPDI